jgi:hypothetical protein
MTLKKTNFVRQSIFNVGVGLKALNEQGRLAAVGKNLKAEGRDCFWEAGNSLGWLSALEGARNAEPTDSPLQR